MSIVIPQETARQRLEEALQWAQSDDPVPEEWLSFSRQIFQLPSKTYTPALGGVLLARATDERIDPLSLKAGHAENTYSLRNLCHNVLVPAAQEYGFSIRNTGREPLNNQPFFRYEYMTQMEKVRDRPGHAYFMSRVTEIGSLDESHALAAFAAYLRVAMETAQQIRNYDVNPSGLTLQRTVRCVEIFLTEGVQPAHRTQALAAAAFDVTHGDVRSRRLNDPSRDYPGDIQVFEADKPILAAEVRAKPVPATEVQSFVSACQKAHIDRAFMIVLFRGHRPLPVADLREEALQAGALLTVIERTEDLLLDVFGWADVPLAAAVEIFSKAVLERLKEVEVSPASLQRWVDLVDEAHSK